VVGQWKLVSLHIEEMDLILKSGLEEQRRDVNGSTNYGKILYPTYSMPVPLLVAKITAYSVVKPASALAALDGFSARS
jgi:hypothetical protein